MFGKVLVFITCIAACVANPAAEKHTAQGIAEFTAAYAKWDAARFAKAAEFFRQAEIAAPQSATNAAWQGAALFHLMLHHQSSGDDAAAKTAQTAAISALESAVKWQAPPAEAHILLVTLYGMKIQSSSMNAITLGPALLRHRKLAEQHGPANPRVRYLIGTGQYHTAKNDPARNDALATLLAAEKLFQAEAKKSPANFAHRWGHSTSLTFIGLAHDSLHNIPAARSYFQKALTAHPADHQAKAGLARLKDKN